MQHFILMDPQHTNIRPRMTFNKIFNYLHCEAVKYNTDTIILTYDEIMRCS